MINSVDSWYTSKLGKMFLNIFTLKRPVYTLKESINENVTLVGETLSVEDPDTSKSVWRIYREVKTATTYKKEFAGAGDFDQVWNNRLTLFPAAPATDLLSLVPKDYAAFSILRTDGAITGVEYYSDAAKTSLIRTIVIERNASGQISGGYIA